MLKTRYTLVICSLSLLSLKSREESENKYTKKQILIKSCDQKGCREKIQEDGAVERRGR